MKNFYTAREAMEKLGLKKSTFYDLIKRGDIPGGIVLPLRRHALYPKTTIDDLAEERARILGEYEQEPERLQFVIPTPEDFEQVVEIDSTLFPEETWMSPELLQKRLSYNSEVTHVLKDTKTDTVLGYISMSPLKQDILEKADYSSNRRNCTKARAFHPLSCQYTSGLLCGQYGRESRSRHCTTLLCW